MFITFTLGNWMSFRDEVTFSMVASKERQHGPRTPQLKKYKMRVLPIATIYGGNASGKSNFFQAIAFARKYIIAGLPPDSPIPVMQYLLDEKYRALPTYFRFELLAGDNIYEYSFSITREKVVNEKLVAITGSSEKLLFNRSDDTITLGDTLKNDSDIEVVARGTRDNTLFLTNAVSQKVEKFQPVYNWFRDTLVLIGPDDRFQSTKLFFDERHKDFQIFNTMLNQLDTGISHLGGVDVPVESLPHVRGLGLDFQHIKEGESIPTTLGDERFVVSRVNGQLVAKKLVAYHKASNQTDVRFEIWQESDGSLRLINLLPAFLAMSGESSNFVFIIDEIDRSLHTLLTRTLLEFYLEKCSAASRNQLLLTTHDVLLMDQHLLRRDEMWVAERDNGGASTLIPFSEYKDVRYDKDIRKSYLQGRLGGVPKILVNTALSAVYE